MKGRTNLRLRTDMGMCSLLKGTAKGVACAFWEMLVIIGHGRIANTHRPRSASRSALSRRLGWLPISVLSTAQNFGVVMGCTPKRLVKKFQSLPPLICTFRKERLSCTTPQEQRTKIPHDY